jgi:hypothetical protein
MSHGTLLIEIIHLQGTQTMILHAILMIGKAHLDMLFLWEQI